MQDSNDPLGTGTPYPLSTSGQQGHRSKFVESKPHDLAFATIHCANIML